MKHGNDIKNEIIRMVMKNEFFIKLTTLTIFISNLKIIIDLSLHDQF